ncbi:MAG: hypothetical protein AAGJ81_05090 [Verrucomicrobiota bacterium]
MQAVSIFGNASFIEKIFGVGVGQFVTHASGPYAFSLYLTALAEQGVMGLVLTVSLFTGPVFVSFWKMINKRTRSTTYLLVFSIAVVLSLSNLFYELKNAFPLWITLGWLYAMVNSRPWMVLESDMDIQGMVNFRKRMRTSRRRS